MKRILFVCALEKEIKEIQRYYNEHRDTFLYMADFLLTDCGRAGVVSTLVKVLFRNKYDLVINVGTCGVKIKSEQTTLPLGSLIEPSEVYDGDLCFENRVKKISLGLNKSENNIPLVTVSEFRRYDAHMNQTYIEDMEGFEIANICTTLNQPFKIIKIVSNYITNNPDKDLTDFYENYEKVTKLNTENIFNKINGYNNFKKVKSILM